MAVKQSVQIVQKAKSYRDLVVWQKALNLGVLVYKLTQTFPKEELYGLQSQMRRAAVALPSNIAEGQARGKRIEFARFLRMGLGSLAELDTQIELAVRLHYLEDRDVSEARASVLELRKMLFGLIRVQS